MSSTKKFSVTSDQGTYENLSITCTNQSEILRDRYKKIRYGAIHVTQQHKTTSNLAKTTAILHKVNNQHNFVKAWYFGFVISLETSILSCQRV